MGAPPKLTTRQAFDLNLEDAEMLVDLDSRNPTLGHSSDSPCGRLRSYRDREEALASFRRLVALGADTVCVPHGVPLRTGAREVLAAATPATDWL
ncbi:MULTISPECIES: P-loop NTPase family protein [Streptomyces]|uniref:hypothetical protein n=1 Tax=Streptomyces TaxID=1883 RepID=UPI0024A01E1F|nr:hypothetical protein [Streptomyces sp. NBRC 13847]GLW13459.1 hypothetical protein Stsp01_02020 [Streptomyces sp. NBRC 13847]